MKNIAFSTVNKKIASACKHFLMSTLSENYLDLLLENEYKKIL